VEWILPLERINLKSVSSTGGKAARLGALLQAGFNVPGGFVITANAFQLHHPVLLEEAPPPPILVPAFRTALTEAFTRHFEPGERVAVRSSAINEDGAGMSFAGQHATYYWIGKEQLEQAVMDCWRSLWSPAALAYRTVWDETVHPMAVIVQRMVRATRSGVCFSRDPLDPVPGTVVIEGCFGLGAALVDGRVQPDRLKVDERGGIVELQIGDKQMMVPATIDDPTGTRLELVPENLRTTPVLSAREAIALHEATEQIEVLFDQAVDVEWAFDERQLHILQARPITTTSAPPVIQRRLVLFKPLAENFSEPMTPMSVDLFASVLPRVAEFVRGRLYLDFDRIKPLLPLDASDAELIDILLLRRSPSSLRLSLSRLLAASAVGATAWLAFGTFWSRSTRVRPETLERRFPPWLERLQQHSALPVPLFFRRMLFGTSPFVPVWQLMLQLNISAGRYFVLIGLLQSRLHRWAPAFDDALIDDLVHDGGSMWSKRMVADVSALATIAAAHTDSDQALRAEDQMDQVRQLAADHPFVLALGRFLQRFGHRGPREIDLATARWREDVTPLLIMIRNQMLHAADGRDDRYARHLVARDLLRKSLPSSLKRAVINTLLKRIRYYITLREDTRHYHSMIFDALRARLLAVEHELLREGKLKCEGDIFFLRYNEVDALRAGQAEARDMSALIRERRIAHLRESRALPPETFGLRTAKRNEDHPGSSLRGQCACAGEVTGIARIVLRADQAQALKPGEIMVAPYTDPSWTPLFPPLAGIVVGIGSYLSHAGTIAREYRIPCLVDVKGCIEHIPDGHLIRLNASAGYVELLTSSADESQPDDDPDVESSPVANDPDRGEPIEAWR
jgi:pyruvate,water dikinase